MDRLEEQAVAAKRLIGDVSEYTRLWQEVKKQCGEGRVPSVQNTARTAAEKSAFASICGALGGMTSDLVAHKILRVVGLHALDGDLVTAKRHELWVIVSA